MLQYVYGLYHEPTKSYVLESGYYGNCVNIACFSTKEKAVSHINMYMRNKGYKPKRFKIKQSDIQPNATRDREPDEK